MRNSWQAKEVTSVDVVCSGLAAILFEGRQQLVQLSTLLRVSEPQSGVILEIFNTAFHHFCFDFVSRQTRASNIPDPRRTLRNLLSACS